VTFKTRRENINYLIKLLDNLIRDYKNPEDLLTENDTLKQLTKALLERAIIR